MDNRKLRLQPQMDVRFGVENVKSRAGLEMAADLLIEPKDCLNLENFVGLSCLLVDEAQFLSKEIIDQFREITLKMDIPVICYGLRTDFKSNLFEGSQRLLEIADSIEEMKSTCYFCNKKSIFM